MLHKSLQFSNLPLREVVLRAIFERSVLPYSSLLRAWRAIADEYPEPADSAVLEWTAGATPSVRVAPILRAQSTDRYVDFAAQSVASGWHADLLGAYPRYASVRAGLETALEAVSATALTEAPLPTIVNITYTNLLAPPPSADASSWLVGLFVPEVLPAIMAGGSVHDLNMSWHRKDEAADIRVTIQPVQIAIADSNAPGDAAPQYRAAFSLSTVAGCVVGDSASLTERLDSLHSLLQEVFLSLVSDRARNEWGFTHG